MILVTGGLGYIGSHTTVELLKQYNGDDILIVDDLSNSTVDVLDSIEKISSKRPKLIIADLADFDQCDKIFKENKIDTVIHFAGFKAVGESVEKPLMYYRNNLVSTLNILDMMEKYDCKKIIFSSSATVYGEKNVVPMEEGMDRSHTNPYGATKLMTEDILTDVAKIHPDWTVILLRYFNPAGNHESGLMGENPKGKPNNLMPYVLKVAIGEYPYLTVFGNDYDTVDGTGVRDYIHVVDLAKGHVKALEKALKDNGLYIYNLGTGKGTSVLEMVEAFEKATGKKVPVKICDRRPGDIGTSYAKVQKAKDELGFEATKTVDDMCKDMYTYYTNLKN